MPPPGKGPRLYLRHGRADGRPAIWVIRDGSYEQSTRCRRDDRIGAEKALADYIARKHLGDTARQRLSPDKVPVAQVIALYGKDIAPTHARPHETGLRLGRLLRYFGGMWLSDINGQTCRAYAEARGAQESARRELADLRAAINHHHAEGLCTQAVRVVLPPRRPARERWLSRKEAADLLRACRRLGFPHVARFILVGLYTGRRYSAIVEAALGPARDRGWIDLDRGLFNPRQFRKITKKRQPVIPLPRRLLAHLRRWHRRGARYVVEWQGRPVVRIEQSFRKAVLAAGLGRDVIPHTLRHTAATWAMQSGADPWAIGGYLGMSLETLTRVYGHHHPGHLSGALAAFGQRPGVPKTYTDSGQAVPGAAPGIHERKGNRK
jgi:integrase